MSDGAAAGATGPDPTFNPYQYDDLLHRSADLYANTKYEIIRDYLAGRKGLDILNAGCGSGELCLQLAQAGHRVLGIDPAAEYIELARRNARRLGTDRCRFLVSSIEELAEGRQFDCVMATDVLEHIADDHTAFAKLVERARPGGLVIITVPAGQWLFGYHDESIGHYRRYSLRTLRRLAVGLCRVERLRYFGFSLIPVCYLYSKVLRRPYPVSEAGDTSKNPLVARALRTLLRLDKRLPMPFGTSVLMKAVRHGAGQTATAGRRAA
jgi:2-polyprenyl-3-methyl-5-hydroxy-6-metoxy-1,4-benzoquinol methylase